MNIVEGVVEKVFVNEPKEGNYGTFYPQVLKVNGQLYTKNAKSGDPIANEGDTVKFLYETKTSAQGKEFHNISGSKGAFEILSAGSLIKPTTETKAVAEVATHEAKKTTTTKSSEASTSSSAKSTTVITAKDRSIARQSSLKVAAELLKADSTKPNFDLQELTQLTLQLEEFVLSPYQQG